MQSSMDGHFHCFILLVAVTSAAVYTDHNIFESQCSIFWPRGKSCIPGRENNKLPGMSKQQQEGQLKRSRTPRLVRRKKVAGELVLCSNGTEESQGII